MSTEVYGTAESVCPECLRRIPARKVIDSDRVYLVKECPEHGSFQVLIWEGEPRYERWANPKKSSTPAVCATEVVNGCPFDCGLCPDHRQQACCVVLEVTGRCNLYCPICFASAEEPGPAADPGLNVIESWYRKLLVSGGPYNIQLSGGEPTVRDDLPDIVKLGHQLGFEYIQLNTNGLRLAREPRFVERLKEAGLNCVFLQFDGMSDRVYQALRGVPLMETKLAAIERCAENEIGVVLVPTLVRDVNLSHIGAILRLAEESIPKVRGVHFQPISYFGRYPAEPPADRITIPEILREIENQSAGKMRIENFLPGGAENAYCSFHGNFLSMPDGTLKPLTSSQTSSCCTTSKAATEGSQKTRQFVARQWSAPKCGNCQNTVLDHPDSDLDSKINTASLDAFLERVNTYTLTVSGMAFQDAWNLELDRLRECKIQVFNPDGRLIPFCAYNLTAKDGRSLYRKREVPG